MSNDNHQETKYKPGQFLATDADVLKALIDGQRAQLIGYPGDYYELVNGKITYSDGWREHPPEISKNLWQIPDSTNKPQEVALQSAKFFLVAETELDEAVTSVRASVLENFDPHFMLEMEQALQKCKARPVPQQASHFSWEVGERDENGLPMVHFEEIHK